MTQSSFKKSHRFLLLKDLQALQQSFQPSQQEHTFMASKSVMLTSTFVAIERFQHSLAQQKRIAKWTLNHFPNACSLPPEPKSKIVICCVV
jgi:hypothetical protein